MQLKDLEELQHEVVDQRTRPLVREVIKSYEAGALRAATVSLWIAVVADLTYKIRRLAESGDGEAHAVIDSLDKAIENSAVNKVQQYERKLLETATNKLGILSPRERSELSRLSEDRNLCAHPGFVSESEIFVPDAETVRAHLVVACRSVFSQRPLSGRRLLEILQSELERESWPKDDEYFLDRFFRSARDSVKDNICKMLIKGSARLPEGDDRSAQRCRESVRAIARDAPSSFERNLSSVVHNWEDNGTLGDRELVRLVGAYGRFSSFWTVLPDTAKSRLTTLLDALLKKCETNTCEANFLLNEQFFASGLPADDAVAETSRKILGVLDTAQLSCAIQQSQERGVFVGPAIKQVHGSWSFREAEANLRLVELCSRELTASDIADLHEAIKTNQHDQVRLASGSQSILMSIYEGSRATEGCGPPWRALAAWLRQTGKDNGNDDYLYEGLCNAVGADD